MMFASTPTCSLIQVSKMWVDYVGFYSCYLNTLTWVMAELKSLPLRVSISDWIAVSVLVCAASDMHTSSWQSIPVSAAFRQLSRRLSSSDMLVTFKF